MTTPRRSAREYTRAAAEGGLCVRNAGNAGKHRRNIRDGSAEGHENGAWAGVSRRE